MTRKPMKRISILGSTGSIGRQCLDVVAANPDKFQVVAIAAGQNINLAAEQARQCHPQIVSVATEAAAKDLCAILKTTREKNHPQPEILFGAGGMERVATHHEAEIIVSAAVGVVGLPATFKAIEAGKHIALLPVDSEHNAIHQCLRAGEPKEVKRLILTASGGPFRKTPLSHFAKITPKQALAHPNWKMGQRITIDSATLMNKGFEVIEAKWLFGTDLDRIQVVIHPQSTIHSMVEFVDGSILAQLGPTDMRMPIQYALTYPERVPSNTCALDWSTLRKLEFAAVPLKKFPCLTLAKEAARQGGPLPCALNAADEIAVAAFLEKRLPFLGIAAVIEKVLEKMPRTSLHSIADVLEADAEARRLARQEIQLVSRRGKN